MSLKSVFESIILFEGLKKCTQLLAFVWGVFVGGDNVFYHHGGFLKTKYVEVFEIKEELEGNWTDKEKWPFSERLLDLL